ncbi:probable methyltransferase-like protein 25 [Euwallacea fornicatus]|uniref:probable methyltransferase-like protein 25 n=1 Tax=Euwallacea fornicatus TaxID=995702 RepID=UPI00338EAE77
MQINKCAIAQQIEKTIQHLESHLALANVHMVDYFNNDIFIKHVPKNIQEEVNSCGFHNAIQAIYDQETEHLPNLHQYIQKSRQLCLKNTLICMSFDQFRTRLEKLGSKQISHLKLDVFMKPKKSHEVEVLSGVVAAVNNIAETTHIIDIGDGKGYLSSMLALHYKIPVLGVDASEVNTNGAVNRANKLSKVWNGVVTNVHTHKTSIDLYKQITKYVDETVDFKELVSNIFLETSGRIGLVGLHTCGDLAANCLKIYNKHNDIKMICNVGCCYNHLTEHLGKERIGFPLSNLLREKKFKLNRGARMVAAQSIERILHLKERPSKTIFYRSIFEILIQQSPSAVKKTQVGRFRKKSPNFVDYARRAAKRINLPLEQSDKDISTVYSKFEHRQDEIDLFYLLRAMLAPVVESVVLLDRLLFLYENEHNESYLVQFFDPVVSPRCYGIVSIKI